MSTLQEYKNNCREKICIRAHARIRVHVLYVLPHNQVENVYICVCISVVICNVHMFVVMGVKGYQLCVFTGRYVCLCSKE